MTTNVLHAKKNACPQIERQAFSVATMTELASFKFASERSATFQTLTHLPLNQSF